MSIYLETLCLKKVLPKFNSRKEGGGGAEGGVQGGGLE